MQKNNLVFSFGLGSIIFLKAFLVVVHCQSELCNKEFDKLKVLLNKTDNCVAELEGFFKGLIPSNEPQFNDTEYDYASFPIELYFEDSTASRDSSQDHESCAYYPPTSSKLLAQVACNYKQYREECYNSLEVSRKALLENDTYCPGEFDGFICWPYTKNETMAEVPCPHFLERATTEETTGSYRFCMGNGTWFQQATDYGTMETWRYLGSCNPMKQLNEIKDDFVPAEGPLFTQLTIAYKVGYGVSITFLLAALLIFTSFKKLHCVRNYIHMNLMISFIFRYVTMMVHGKVLDDHYSVSIKNPLLNNETCEEYLNSDDFISCRLVTALWHYMVASNYFWLLVEGIHLLILLTRPLNSSRSKKHFMFYLALGWFVPVFSVLVWVGLRIAFENADCWAKNGDLQLWWALEVPIMLTIVINFFIFLYVICVILSKLRTRNRNNSDYRISFAWSTLTLMPLLGIHYCVFLAIDSDAVGPTSILASTKLVFETIATSFQGFLVALFYCFLNTEVQGEMKKRWNKWQTLRNLHAPAPRKLSGNQPNYTQATSLASSMHADEKLLLNCKETHLADLQV